MPSHLEVDCQNWARARAEAQSLYKAYEQAKANVDMQKEKVEAQLRAEGLKSARLKDFTVTIAERAKVVIMHEPSVIEWIKSQPNLESDLYIGLKKQAFEPIAKIAMSKNGEVIPGCAVEITEYPSLRDNRKDKK